MFDLGNESEQDKLNEIKYKFEEHEEMTKKDLLHLEKEMLGIYISGHPLEKLKDEILRKTTINTMDMRQIDEKMSSNANQDNMELLKQAR